MKEFTIIWEDRWQSGSHWHCLTKKSFVRAESIHHVMKSDFGAVARFIFEGFVCTLGETFSEKDVETIIDDTVKAPQFDRKRHGGLHDRGSADAYYGRAASPHWYPLGTGKGERVENLTEEEIAEYQAGYDGQIASGEFKQY
jgi:hypothetical protein